MYMCYIVFFSDKLNAIYSDRKVTEDAQAAISLLQMSQEDQQKSATSHERKDRILSLLFENRNETLTKINLFRGLLERFHGFVKIFQSEKPLIHTLHREMFNVTREVLGMFIKPEHIPESVREVLNLDVSNESLQKSDKELQVGRYAFVSMNKARMEKKNQHWVRSLYSDLRAGYIAAAKKLLKMPLGNRTLRKLSVLDPHLANHNQASSSIKALAMSLPNVIDENEAGALAVEADRYSTDRQVSELATSYDENQMRIDVHYWAKVFNLKTFNEPRYPMLQKFISAMLSIFSGPLIESTFNIMDDIVEKDRSKLTVENYEAMAIIKTALKRKKISAVEMTINADMKKACIKAYSTYQQFLAKKKEAKEQKREEKLKDSVMLLKKEKAKRVAKLIKLKNKRLQGESLKRKKQNVAEGGKSRWKRIKML